MVFTLGLFLQPYALYKCTIKCAIHLSHWGSGAASEAIQDHHAPAVAHQPFAEQPSGASTGGIQDTQNWMPGGNTGFEFEHTSNLPP
jgi:hypothetical protein